MPASRKSAPDALPPRQLRAISRVLADPRRFEILKLIASRPASSCTSLCAAVTITAPTLSHHLKELESAGLIEIARSGKFVLPTFCRPVWNAYLAQLREI